MEFRPLITVEPPELFDLLIEERRDWVEALSWDPSDAQQLLLKYVGNHMLPGMVAFDGGRLVGYTYYLTREQTGLIGTLYLARSHRQADLVSDLLAATLDCMRQFSSIDRIETQVFPFGVDLVPIFSGFGFQLYRRHYLCKTLAPDALAVFRTPSPSDRTFDLSPWNPQHLERAAMVVQAGYTGSIDLEICTEYGTYESCLNFLSNLINNPGCGTFLPQASFVATNVSRLISGVVLTSKLSAATALIAQIAVLPGYQSCGLGSALMASALSRLRDLGYAQVCLSVSERNERAYTWYRSLGFEPRKELLAFVWHRQTA